VLEQCGEREGKLRPNNQFYENLLFMTDSCAYLLNAFPVTTECPLSCDIMFQHFVAMCRTIFICISGPAVCR